MSRFKPTDSDVIFHIKVAVTVDADPSMVTERVRTFTFVILVGTFLAHVATKVTLKAWPVWH